MYAGFLIQITCIVIVAWLIWKKFGDKIMLFFGGESPEEVKTRLQERIEQLKIAQEQLKAMRQEVEVTKELRAVTTELEKEMKALSKVNKKLGV